MDRGWTDIRRATRQRVLDFLVGVAIDGLRRSVGSYHARDDVAIQHDRRTWKRPYYSEFENRH